MRTCAVATRAELVTQILVAQIIIHVVRCHVPMAPPLILQMLLRGAKKKYAPFPMTVRLVVVQLLVQSGVRLK